MYRCEKCGEVFEHPAEERENFTYDGYFETFYVCPACGSDHIEEAVQCKLCEEYKFLREMSFDDDRYCLACVAEVKDKAYKAASAALNTAEMELFGEYVKRLEDCA